MKSYIVPIEVLGSLGRKKDQFARDQIDLCDFCINETFVQLRHEFQFLDGFVDDYTYLHLLSDQLNLGIEIHLSIANLEFTIVNFHDDNDINLSQEDGMSCLAEFIKSRGIVIEDITIFNMLGVESPKRIYLSFGNADGDSIDDLVFINADFYYGIAIVNFIEESLL